MSKLEDKKNSDIEITDLDVPGTVHKAFGTKIIQGQRLSAWSRWFLLLLTILGSIAFLFLLLANIPHGSKNTQPPGTPTVAPLVPRVTSIIDEVMYISLADRSIQALNASDGTLLWRHKNLLDAYAVAATNGIVCLVEQQSGTIDALRVKDGSLVWQYKPGEGFSWPHVENGFVYIGSGNTVKALRASDGVVAWQQNAIGGFWASNGLVYAVPAAGSIAAFRGNDGVVVWQQKIDGAVLGVDNHAVYLDLPDHSVAALHSSDGMLLWQQSIVKGNTFSQITDNALYFLTGYGDLYVLSTSDGSLLWHKQIPAANFLNVFADNQIVYLSSQSGGMDFLRASDGSLLWRSTAINEGSFLGSGAEREMVYFRAPGGEMDARNVNDGTLLWHRPINGILLLIEKNILYLSTDSGKVQALRATDGALFWQSPLLNLN